MLGQDVGFPVPQGGAQHLSDALANRFRALGGQIRTGTPVTAVRITHGRATGVRCADGTVVHARRAVLADVAAPTLYADLVGEEHLSPGLRRSLQRFQWDNPTLKINWALRNPVPWRAAGAHGAGTVHFGVDVDGFVDFAADLSIGRMPRHPFVLFGQMTTSDPTRSPEGTESAWAYTHVPGGPSLTEDALATHVTRIEETLEALAPGFADSVLARHVQRPAELEAADANLVGGATNSGTAAHPPATVLPSNDRHRPTRDTLPGAVSRERIRPSRRRRARRAGLERRAVGDRRGRSFRRRPPPAQPDGMGPATSTGVVVLDCSAPRSPRASVI